MTTVQTKALRQPKSYISLLRVVRGYITLTKPRIMVLLLFTAYCATVVAAHGLPSFQMTFPMLLGLALSTGGASAINMWYDRDIDGVMTRTSSRPIPAGIVEPWNALWFGIALEAISFFVLLDFINGMTAFLALGGFLYYAVVYTMWLKRTTPHNTVIGGGAGAIPPLIGWASVTGHLSPLAVMMFAIIFLWTPPHFWALALFKNDDYTRAGIPMMPVVRGARATKRQSVSYSVFLGVSAVALYFMGAFGWVYLTIAIVLSTMFIGLNLLTWLERDDEYRWAERTFFGSLIYLPVLFTFMVIGSVL